MECAIRQVWTQLYKALALSLCLLPCLTFAADDAETEIEPGFEVLAASAKEVDGVIRINAGFNLRLSDELIEAVHSGVPIIINVEMELWRERGYWLDEEVTTIVQSYLIDYNALTRQYILQNINTSAHFTLPSLEATLGVISGLQDFPFIDSNLLEPDSKHYFRIRLQTDIDSLPVPLRVMGYISSRWHLSSEWYSWPLP